MRNPNPHASSGVPYIVPFRYRSGDTRKRLLARLRRLAALGDLDMGRVVRSKKVFFKGCTESSTAAMLMAIRDTEAVFNEVQRAALIASGRGDLSKEVIENISREIDVVVLRKVEVTETGRFDIEMAASNCFPEFGADIWLKGEVRLAGGFIFLTRWGGKSYRAVAQQIKGLLGVE